MLAAILASALVPMAAIAVGDLPDVKALSGEVSDVQVSTLLEEGQGDVSGTESGADESETYTLHLTHAFRFSVDGKNRSVQASETITLTNDDFADGVCDLSRFAYNKEQLTMTKADVVSLNDFAAQGGQAGGRIVYSVNDGWTIVKASDDAANGTPLREVFTGSGLDDYAFVPANVVRVTLDYQYSSTGALAGSSVFSSDTLEAQPVKQADGTYVVEWSLPVKDGFRIVLDPSPLNAYLVNPPTGNETPEENLAKLENGDYNVNVENSRMPVYYSQEHPGVATNPNYSNQYSEQYNEAWDAARVLTVSGNEGYTVEAVCGNSDGTHPSDEKHGASALANPKVRVILTEAQMNSVVKGTSKLGTITVSYRRNATTYAVNHWVPKELTYLTDDQITSEGYEKKTEGGIEYIRFDRDEHQGRVGALTKARPYTEGPVYSILVPDAFSQEVIGNNTEIDLNYHPISPVRVLFDTDYTYIPRQQVEIGGSINFVGMSTPTRMGYTFGGWQYIKRDAIPDASGSYSDDAYQAIDGTVAAPSLVVSDALIAKAKVDHTDGMLVLHLYPKWVPAQTQVRVVFWTEDLAGGAEDVYAHADGGNTEAYAAKYADYQNEVRNTLPHLGQNNADTYSNVGSFTFNITTGSALTDTDGNLLQSVRDQIDANFETTMMEGSLSTAEFYSFNNFEITAGSNGETKAVTSASADGKTTIYVYYTRNVYELKFHYYGSATDTNVGTLSSSYAVAIQTDGFSYAPGGASSFVDSDGNLDFDYQNPDYNPSTGANNYARNQWKVPATSYGTATNPNTAGAANMTASNMTVPQTITIRAKYGADLREVWPVARTNEEQATAAAESSTSGVGSNGQTLRMISWATTAGPYNQKARTQAANSTTRSQAEPTIMGTYGGMGSEIIADPNSPYVSNDQPGTTHHLVAYWNAMAVNYYTNNHCFELPGLDSTTLASVTKTYIYDQSLDNPQNIVYLVPKDNPTIAQYGFTDLMLVSYDGTSIAYDDPNGTYYAVRWYNGKAYAVARRVQTLSTAGIAKQNPSARLHMTRANTVADHNTEFTQAQEGADTNYGIASNDINNPYQLYFYYDRDRYTIYYMVPSNVENAAKPEYELGHSQLPYGALVTKEKYGFKLNYQDNNHNSAYTWTPAAGAAIPVCPDRATNGTKAWNFRGWALGPSGTNMQWSHQGTRPIESDFAIQGNLRVYAIWNAPTYTVDFDYNGGVESATGQTSLSQDIPANTRYVTSGVVPRPLYEGHTLVGWFVANPDGTPSDQEFNFDSNVSADQKVVAKWAEVTEQEYSYTIYYISKTLTDPSAAGSFEQVTVGSEQWYVIGKTEHKNLRFSGQTDINVAAKPIEGYIPEDSTNQVLDISSAGNYQAYVRYTTPEAANHVVRYVLAGTEDEATPTVVLEYAASVDQVVTTPDGAESKRLVETGYELVNREDDGTYQRVMAGNDVTWIDADGNIQSVQTLQGANVPKVITYLVQPLVFTVTYVNAPGSPAAADAQLASITAPQATYPADAAGKNPTRYIATDAFAVINPTRVQQDGKWYKFSHWSLGSGTTLGAASRAAANFATLTVDKGTVGNLTFVANWVAEDEPDDPNKLVVDNKGNGSSGANGVNGQGLNGKKLPATGDSVTILPLVVIAVVAALVAIVAAAMLRRRQRLVVPKGAKHQR